MALAVGIEIGFTDDKGKASSTVVRVPTGFSLAQYAEFGTAICQLLANISDCVITGASVNFGVDLSGLGLKVSAQPLADVAEKAQLIWNTAASGFKKIFRIPTFREALVNAGSDTINTADVDLAAYVSAIENGISVTGGTVAPSDARGNDIVSLGEAREQFRRTLV